MSTHTEFGDLAKLLVERLSDSVKRGEDFEITVTGSEQLTNRGGHPVHGMRLTVSTASASFCAEDACFLPQTVRLNEDDPD